MFKAPFSFEGRIRRTEYWLSQLLQFPLLFAWAFLADINGFLGIALLIPYIWFALACGTKRCHDRGNPGIFMLIPFYGLWMAFADSEPGDNQYGPNPKGK
jgi:uncharacterized membrane protein YhaH (DUF805 family)